MSKAYQIFSEYLYYKAGQQGIPLSGTFELTSRCNLDCKMCYIHKRANDAKALRLERSTEEWLALARECCDAGTLLLLLTGGEPLLRTDFCEIYTKCRRMGMMVSINTNGTLIDERMADFLAQDPPARVNITLYGASPETYGALCGVPSAFDRALRGILLLKERGVLVKLNYSVTPYNRADAEQVYEFARDSGIDLQAATYMFPPVRACEQGRCTAERMTAWESSEAQIAYDRFRFSDEELKARWEDQLRGIRVPDPDQECQELPTERIRCRAGSSTYWVTWDWKMRPCGLMTVPSVDLEAGHFQQAWEEIRRARETIMVPARCTGCEMRNACNQCAALCYAETGSFTEVPTYMCEKTRAYLELAQKALAELNAAPQG